VVASRREVGPELLLGALAQLAEHSQVGLAVRPAHHGPGTSEGSGVRLVGADVEQIAEGFELALPGVGEDGTRQVAASEVVEQHAVGRTGCGSERRKPVREAVGQGVLGARVEQPLPDFRLSLPAHQ